ncbi:MAG: ABC transporter permease [Acidobacteriota bacterium]
MNNLFQEARYGFRMLVKNPGFTLVIVLTLALGIGANSALFSVVNAVLLQPLPFAEAERLVTVWNVNTKEGGNGFSVSYPDFNDYRAQQQSFERMAAFRTRDLTLTGMGEAVRLRGATVTSDLLPLLGVAPRLGRVFTPEEDKAGNHAAILSDTLWRTRFKADPNAVGRTVSINSQSYTIVGVMPPKFTFPISSDPAELWIGAAIDNEGAGALTNQRGNHTIEIIGRLKPGATLGQAQAEMSRIAEALEKQHPGENPDTGALLVPFFERVVGDVKLALLLLLGAVGCVLLIACGNVANLLLARAASRQKEVAVRAALGANRWRVVRQLLVESVLLALLGGEAGLLVAWWGTDLLLKLVPGGLPRVGETALNARVLGFTLLISVVTGVLFGLVPALHSSKFDLVTMLKEGGRGTGDGGRSNRTRNTLIVAQVAIAFVLLVCAGLLANSFWRLQQVNPGFDPKNVLTFRVSLPVTRYAQNEQVESFYQRLTSRVAALPGVTSVSATSVLPLSGQNSGVGFAIEGVPTEPNKPFPNESSLRIVQPGYFGTMKITLLQGRDFDARDTLMGSQVVIINETLARKHFAGQNPIGRRINPSFAIDQRGIQWREIIGIVKDVHHASLKEAADEESYVSHAQAPVNTITMVARTNNDPHNLIASVRREVGALDGELPIFNVRTLEENLSRSLAQQRFNTLLLVIFGGVALLLTAVGLYGVLAYSVTQRTHEFGIRLALGAQAGNVLGLVLQQGMKLTLIGVGIGLIGALALTRLMAGFVFGVGVTDPMTFAAIALLLITIALFACYIPARRATKVEATVALRYE